MDIETKDKEVHVNAQKGIDNTKQLNDIIGQYEVTINTLKAEITRLKGIIIDFKDLVGEDNFQEILSLRGYQSKK